MPQRVVWVHGIGEHHPGYSAPWKQVFNPFLNLPDDGYIEVCWDTVFTGGSFAADGTEVPTFESYLHRAAITPRQQVQAAAVRAELATILQARAAAIRPASAAAQAFDVARPLEWSEYFGPAAPAQAFGLFPEWLTNPNAYLGDFVKYLVSRRVRNAVKAKLKEALAPLVGTGDRCAIIAHSWGTVIAYDTLTDLATETPGFQVADLFTLGSPLWLARPFLQDNSGHKPLPAVTWINVHAEGDAVGAYLRPGFAVDADYLVPSVGPDPHGSYFAPGNDLVQRDIVAAALRSEA